MDFKTYAKTNDRRCALCRVFEEDPEAAAEIREAWASKRPPTPAVVAGYLSDERGHAITNQVVKDHLRKRHEQRVS